MKTNNQLVRLHENITAQLHSETQYQWEKKKQR